MQELLGVIDKSRVNIEYMYGLSIDADDAYVVLKASDSAELDSILKDCNIETVSGERLLNS